ncbi:MAG TPA: trypsin-like peptidase domain-containing protein, partial [Humisphaera sp.]|nr:trypsin-like peptidase domain-containing protein [Humisphaera sp.]
MNRLRRSVAAIVIAGGACGVWFAGSALVHNVAFSAEQRKVETTRDQLATTNDLSAAFRNVGTVLEPSVVNIQVRKTVKGGSPFNEDLLRKFFRDRNKDNENPDKDDEQPQGEDGQGFEQVGTGSGFILEVEGGNTGYILTNNHVAGGATEMIVTLADGRRIENAKLVGADPKSDLAVVRINADHLVPAKWGDSSALHRGEWILAFGSPFGYVGSMTHGIVSALDRSNVGILGASGYEDFIQVDAPINPGNSGGPLVNLNGEVVGINTAIASRTGAFSGIGFAIPVREARFVYTALKDHGKVVRGWLGVSIADVARDSKLAASFGYKGSAGVLVESTLANTPASGKLAAGDIIESVDGKPVESVLQLRNAIAADAPNTEIKMAVWRDNKDVPVAVKLGTQPKDLSVAASGATQGENADSAMGMTLSNVSDEMAQRLNLGDERQGALVTHVQHGSRADKAGLRPGDLILKVDDKAVKSASQATDLLSKADVKNGVRLY